LVGCSLRKFQNTSGRRQANLEQHMRVSYAQRQLACRASWRTKVVDSSSSRPEKAPIVLDGPELSRAKDKAMMGDGRWGIVNGEIPGNMPVTAKTQLASIIHPSQLLACDCLENMQHNRSGLSG
jgi:hypothetical protein